MNDVLAASVLSSALILLGGAIAKLPDRAGFSSQIAAYDILPRTSARVVANALPFVEIAAGLLLIAVPRMGGFLASSLFILFSAAVSINLLRGRRQLTCGCFGPRGKRQISWAHVLFTTSLAAISASASLKEVRVWEPATFFFAGTLLCLLYVLRAGADLLSSDAAF